MKLFCQNTGDGGGGGQVGKKENKDSVSFSIIQNVVSKVVQPAKFSFLF